MSNKINQEYTDYCVRCAFLGREPMSLETFEARLPKWKEEIEAAYEWVKEHAAIQNAGPAVWAEVLALENEMAL